MTYRVAFAKRFQSDGSESAIDPTSQVDVDLADGVVASKTFVERFEPASQHSQEVLDEDDAFLALASGEIWEYDVVDNRADEFEAALRNSETVMEFEVLDEAGTESDDAAAVSLSDSSTRAPERRWRRPGGVRGISGARDVDDGPAGRPTVDASAAETGPDRPYLGLDDAEGISTEASGGVDDLTVVSEDDPSLGLTEHRKTPPKDWAAAAGASRVPDRGVQSDRPTDKSSTLSPDRD